MTALTVRHAHLADLDTLAELLDQHRQLQGRSADRPACRAFLHERLHHRDSVLFLAERDGRGVGLAQLYPSYSTTALARVYILNDLYVADSARRSGCASALLAAVEAYAWSFGACRISLNVARPNHDAQALYRARGWVADDAFHMYHRFPPGA